jgi:soluble lytic murein transglycosylase-like protein
LATVLYAVALLGMAPAQADIFQYVDENGNIFLTNKKSTSGARKLVRTWHEIGGHGAGQPRIARSDRGVTVDFSRYNDNKRRFTPAIVKISERFRLPPALVHAVVEAESAYNPDAISSAGAVGLMQLMKGTAERFGVSNRTDPIANVYAGTKYLRYLLGMFNNNLVLALAAYNAGENAVIHHGYRVPPYEETREYVKRVLLFYRKHRLAAFAPLAEGATPAGHWRG